MDETLRALVSMLARLIHHVCNRKVLLPSVLLTMLVFTYLSEKKKSCSVLHVSYADDGAIESVGVADHGRTKTLAKEEEERTSLTAVLLYTQLSS